MFRSKNFQAVVMVAAGALLGYVAASGGIRLDRSANASLANSQTSNRAPSDSSVAVAAGAPNGLECSKGNAKAMLFTQADATEQEPLLLAQASKAADQKSSSGNGKKPNILFIMGDDIGWMQPSCYHRGLMVGETPNIDRIANEGGMFMTTTPSQSCTAGRCAFITGMNPYRVGLLLPELPGSRSRSPPRHAVPSRSSCSTWATRPASSARTTSAITPIRCRRRTASRNSGAISITSMRCSR